MTEPTPMLSRWTVAAVVIVAALAGAVFAFWQRALPGRESPSSVLTGHAPASTTPMAADAGSDDVAVPLAQAPSAASSDRGAQPLAPAAAVTAADASLHVVADPPELRVWANTRVRLSVQTDLAFERFVWHFEDGSEPVAGAVVEHVFAESVRDRHVTVEAVRRGQPTEVATLRLPVERLAVETEGPAERPAELSGEHDGARLLFAGGGLDASLADDVLVLADKLNADAVVATGDTASAELLTQGIDTKALGCALLHWPALAEDPGPPLRVVRDPGQKLTAISRGDRELGAWSLADVALTAVDTRTETLAETELKRLHDVLQWMNAYHATLVLSVRPLTQTRDAEVIADRAYRIYEYALRHQVSAVVSASGALFEGRFGGLRVYGIGRAHDDGCVRPLGQDTCQRPAVLVLDVSPRGRIRSYLRTGAGLQEVMPHRELPPEVGKIR